jgi:hypothetical protein
VSHIQLLEGLAFVVRMMTPVSGKEMEGEVVEGHLVERKGSMHHCSDSAET